jgi:hypothetical protein
VSDGYSGRHLGNPDPDDEGFCRCGLGLDAWVHTDNTHYTETPLSALERFTPQGSVPCSEVEGQWRPVEPVHSLACTMLDGACRSMHCPFCGVPTGSQGHLCSERPR